MHDPSGACGGGAGSKRRPPDVNRSRSPKLHMSSTPTVWPATSRDAVPIPPGKSKQVIPVPAPTVPSATSSPAFASAAFASATVTVRASAMSESSHSPTTGITVWSGSPPAASTAAW
jgi:hypothetical protein